VQSFHERYGDIVRIAPDEVSFAKTEAWNEVYGSRHGQPMNKTTIWHRARTPDQKSVLNALDNDDHARMRRAMQPAFTEKALTAQESLIQHHVDLLIQRLNEMTSTDTARAEIDMVQWISFTTLDIIGDLGFGEPFGCLQMGQYDTFVTIIYSFFKSGVLSISLKFFPWITRLLEFYIPKGALEKRKQLIQISHDKVTRRMNLERTRPDFLGSIKRQQHESDPEGLSLTETYMTARVIITAGSETTVSVLSGTVDYLVREPRQSLQRLVQELRQMFAQESNMTLQSLQGARYLHAVIREGLRLCNPTPIGLPREVPTGGATVCGEWLPERVRIPIATKG
jgi:cytochrome P450